MRKGKRREKNRFGKITMDQALDAFKDPGLKEEVSKIVGRLPSGGVGEEEELRKKKGNRLVKKQIFAFIPHELAKVSIFFPMSKKEMKEERREVKNFKHKTSWGEIEINGIKLSIFEEDVLLALLSLVREKEVIRSGQIILNTTIREISKRLYGNAGYTSSAYERIKTGLRHLGLVTFRLKLFSIGREVFVASIIQRYDFEEKTGGLIIKFNLDFCGFYLKSMLTGINYTVRRRLKKDGSKALQKFLATHRDLHSLKILTVLDAINFNTKQPMFRLRSRLKEFITELKRERVIGENTKIYSNDTVFFDVLGTRAKVVCQ